MRKNMEQKTSKRKPLGKEFMVFPGAALLFLMILGLAGCRRQESRFDELTRFARIKTDKGITTHHFTEVYEHFFYPLKDSATKIFEIGIAGGGSLEMWRDYFPRATIYGIDIWPKSELDSDRIKTFVADQADRSLLQTFIGASGGYFDIIIDDGGHTMDQQQISFGFLFKCLKPGGYYVIEDVHTSLPQFWSGFGVEPDGENSTLNMIWRFITSDRLESRYLSPAEERYLIENIEFCNLFARKNRFHSMTCIVQKKTRPQE
jgi:hypothetical protein